MNTVYGIQDLSVVTYNGDQEAHFFLRNWDHVIRFQRTPLDDKPKEEMKQKSFSGFAEKRST